MSSELSKQEYLKRYLEGDDKDKKRKRKPKTVRSILPKVKIVHEDVDIRCIKFGNKEETDEEDCPVVAEVVDERPIEIKSKEIYESSRWKRLGEEQSEPIFDCKETLHKKGAELSLKSKKLLPKSKNRHDSDSDFSPARHRTSDKEPPRSQRQPSLTAEKLKTKKQLRHDSDSDLSPTRPKPQKSTNHNLSPHTNSDSDLSPARPNQRNSPHSPARRSPLVNSNRNFSSEKKGKRKSSFNDEGDSDLSPPRKNIPSSRESSSKDFRPVKTLSGLKAGLQNAATLRDETRGFKKREKSRIEELDDELSGRNASTVVRDKRTGQKRNLEEEALVDDEKKKKLSEQQQKYDKWGKGLIQGEGKSQKLAEDLYETSKPLARYADDEDLEEKLRSEIHDDDPMAQYMRKKKQKHAAVNVYPAYSGPPPPPNRFAIPPGYRWDGVDRSNGFEKRYFEQKSNRKATEEEAYLWSVQDM